MTKEPKAIESKSDMRTVARLLASNGIMSRIDGTDMLATKGGETWITITDFTMSDLMAFMGY